MTAKGGHTRQPAGQMYSDARATLPTCCGCHLISEHQGLRIRERVEGVTPMQPNAPSCLLQGPHSQSPRGFNPGTALAVITPRGTRRGRAQVRTCNWIVRSARLTIRTHLQITRSSR